MSERGDDLAGRKDRRSGLELDSGLLAFRAMVARQQSPSREWTHEELVDLLRGTNPDRPVESGAA